MIENNNNEILANTIKSFVYLDTDKMYSISSQLFSGLTEYILTSSGSSLSNSDEQKGGILEGKLISKIFDQVTENSEKKFLHDYAYNLFEDKLIEDRKVHIIDADTFDNDDEIETMSFVKVKGRLTFHDALMVEETIRNFNDIGYAIQYVTTQSDIRDNLAKTKLSIDKISDKNAKAKAQAAFAKQPSIQQAAIESGLMMNPDYLTNLAWLLNFGYRDSFEVRLPIDTLTGIQFFSGALNRKMLRDTERAILHKYARDTEKEFTIFGILTQSKRHVSPLPLFSEENLPQSDLPQEAIKRALHSLVSAITGIHSSFTGKLENEFIIDPIAVYLEL